MLEVSGKTGVGVEELLEVSWASSELMVLVICVLNSLVGPVMGVAAATTALVAVVRRKKHCIFETSAAPVDP